jgi:hypothetical protein
MIKLIHRNSLKIGLLMLLILSFSVTFASAGEILDQKQEIRDGSVAILNLYPLGQEFTPTLSPLAAVELKIETLNPGSGDDTITVNIRESTIGGTILGSDSKFLEDGFDGWLRFDFNHIPVNPGSIYVIELVASKATFSWGYARSDVYPDGGAIHKGSPISFDQMFRTFKVEPEEPVGGELLPKGTIVNILPYIVTALLLTATSQFFVKKYRS